MDKKMVVDTIIDFLVPQVINASQGEGLCAKLGTFIEFRATDKGNYGELKTICLETARNVLEIDEPDEAILRRPDGHEITLGAARAELYALAKHMCQSWEANPEPGY